MPTDILLNSGFNTTVQTETSSFPYYGIGPVDFSRLNFVKTQQTDYYYDTIGSSTQEVLVSQVTQSYDPAVVMPEIAGLIILFFVALGWGIMRIRRMSKS